jgi:hypothetical protein
MIAGANHNIVKKGKISAPDGNQTLISHQPGHSIATISTELSWLLAKA